ncbi:hypothetical protein [Nocardioides stalactiti]|uniref:hypothetical protein n=1 Tax=Nocardioides stalactiti TaxID=2755356 RepID=UPI0015FFA33A|nr:hypothetical protein [Nocardioides stalactiti]
MLDDVLDEDIATLGDLNLLADAVRLGAVPRLERMLEAGADPGSACEEVGSQIARDRGGADVAASIWACAALGFGVGLVPDEVVRSVRSRPLSARPAHPTVIPGQATVAPSSPAAPTVAAPIGTRAAGIPPAPPRRRVVAWAAGGVVLAALVGAAAAAGVVAMNDDGGREVAAVDGTTTSPAPGTSVSPSSAATAAPSESARPTGSTSPGGDAIDVGGEAPKIDCWNGAEVAALRSCSLPSGVRGLDWIFPRAQDPGCGAIARGHHGRVVDRYCAVDLASGSEAQFHYSQWRDFDRMRLNYRNDQGGADLVLERDDIHAFPVIDVDAVRKVVLYYRLPDAPWAVTIYAESDTDMTLALRLLEIRPVKQLRGVGRQQQNVPASFRVDYP